MLHTANHQIPRWYDKLANDIKSRKLLTMHGGFHSKSNEGDLGLVSVRATVQNETIKIQEYIRKKVPKDKLLSEYLRQ